MPSDKPRIQIRFEEEDFEFLEQWAKSEFIPTTQLCRSIVLRAIATKKNGREDKEKMATLDLKPLTVADVVKQNLPKLKRTGVKNLQAIADEEVLPTAVDFAKIAATLEIPEIQQKIIWQNTFNPSRQGGINNGCT